MMQSGSFVHRLIPSFPSKTFPNHYTLATGLYPDNHGIINNSFYAEDLGGVYRISATPLVTNGASYFGEPIWVTAEEQGVSPDQLRGTLQNDILKEFIFPFIE